MKNIKILMCILMGVMLLPMANSYQIKSFVADNEVPYLMEGGFSMQIITSSGNTTLEPLDDLDVHVTVLHNSVPMFTYCKYQDQNECYLWKTDQNGKVNGLFYVHSQYLVNENYTLEITIGNVTQQQNFTVVEPLSDPSYWSFVYWVKVNLGIFMFGVVLLLLGAMAIYQVFFR